MLATQLYCALRITDRLKGRSAWRAEGPNVPHGWLSQETAVFAIELAGTFVSDLKSRTGGVQTLIIPAGTAGANKLCNPAEPRVYGRDTPIPQAVINAVRPQQWFAAGTDFRPEDAKFATYRMLASCGDVVYRQLYDRGLRQTYCTRYQSGSAGDGTPIQNLGRPRVHPTIGN